jgi:transcriptional regulator with XRE-family HTH domain
MAFGLQLQKLREAKGLSQHALARLADIPQPIISNLEMGTQSEAYTDTARKLAKALKVSLDVLLAEPDLTPLRQESIEFYGDDLITIYNGETQQIYFAPKHLCECIGIDWGSQYKVIKNNEILRDEIIHCDITTDTLGNRETLVMPLDRLSGWLFGIQANRITDPTIKHKLLLYQRECYKVLDDYWRKGDAHNPRESAPGEQVGDAIILIGQRINAVHTQVLDHETRITDLETVTPITTLPGKAKRGIEFPDHVRDFVKDLAQQIGVCLCCKQPYKRRKDGRLLNFHCDHVKPPSWGGENLAINAQPLCDICNIAKGETSHDYRIGPYRWMIARLLAHDEAHEEEMRQRHALNQQRAEDKRQRAEDRKRREDASVKAQPSLF